MTDRPMSPALNGTEQRLDRLNDVMKEHARVTSELCHYLGNLVALLTPVAAVEPDTAQIELKEPDAKPGKRK